MSNTTAEAAEPGFDAPYCYAPSIARHLYSAVADNYAVNVQAHGPKPHDCTVQLVAVFENNHALNIRNCHLRAVAQMLSEAADAIELHSAKPVGRKCAYCFDTGFLPRPAYSSESRPCAKCAASAPSAANAASTADCDATGPSTDSTAALAVNSRS